MQPYAIDKHTLITNFAWTFISVGDTQERNCENKKLIMKQKRASQVLIWVRTAQNKVHSHAQQLNCDEFYQQSTELLLTGIRHKVVVTLLLLLLLLFARHRSRAIENQNQSEIQSQTSISRDDDCTKARKRENWFDNLLCLEHCRMDGYSGTAK